MLKINQDGSIVESVLINEIKQAYNEFRIQHHGNYPKYLTMHHRDYNSIVCALRNSGMLFDYDHVLDREFYFMGMKLLSTGNLPEGEWFVA